MEPITKERDIIFLADESEDSTIARRLLDARHVSYAEIGDTIDWHGPPRYTRPTLLVRGTVFQGLKKIKYAINTNRYL